MRWTRKELKEQAKEALQRNYWKIVLAALLMFCLGGGIGTVGAGGGANNSNGDGVEISLNAGSMDHMEVEDTEYGETDGEAEDEPSGKKYSLIRIDTTSDKIVSAVELNAIGGIIFLTIFTAAFAVIFVVDVFLFNPFNVGVDRFMLKSVDDRAEIREIAYGFDHCYKNIVKTMFHRDLQVFLWALLFIIPGIYKKYQYRMVTYIMAEHPDMDYRSALQMSRDMMRGHKWRSFVLDLSFILWHFLGTITCGMTEIFYVQPYQQLTCAALYRRLSSLDSTEEESAAAYGRLSGRY